MVDRPSQLGLYQIVRQLGEGGMGAVYEAVHGATQRRVAVKVLHPELAKDPALITRLFNEARAVNLIDHPSIVQISDYSQLADGTAYLVMEYLKGESLSRWLERQRGPLALREALQIGWQIASALAVAHAKGIVHRDLKPDNVMLIPDPETPGRERVKLLDFGIAKLLAANAATKKTDTKVIMGTPFYMSPEQCRGAGFVDEKTDVYSLGVMLYELLAGRTPFLGEGSGELIGMHLFKEPPPLRQLAPSVPPMAAELVHRLLAKDKLQRPAMAQLVMELEGLLSNFSSAAAPTITSSATVAADSISPDITRHEGEETSILQRRSPSTLGMSTGQRRIPQPRRLRIAAAALTGILVTSAGVLVLKGVRETGEHTKVRSAGLPTTQTAAGMSVPLQPENPRKVRWSVTTVPAGADVIDTKDGKLLGRTPYTKEQPSDEGMTTVRLRLRGYLDRVVQLGSDADSAVRIELKAATVTDKGRANRRTRLPGPPVRSEKKPEKNKSGFEYEK